MRLPQEIIRDKRDGRPLSEADIAGFIEGLTRDRVTEGQAAAFAMAVFFRGLSLDERVALTRAMTQSGTVLAWDLSGPVLDKHSTGGVGDTVSLPLAAMVAACGGFVPMISGRGLGHTGGTLDKLASIPGYDVAPDLDRFRRVTAEVGCAIIGQTADLAPADRRLYAIRDVTGTVESLDLITASILSKKLAAGLQGLVMDVKTGSGAFMASRAEARALAESIVTVANAAGLRTRALVTDMGRAPGLQCRKRGRGGLRRRLPHRPRPRAAFPRGDPGARRRDAGDRRTRRGCCRGGSAADGGPRVPARACEVFARMVTALGGPGDLVEAPERYLKRAPVVRPVTAPGSGVVERVETRAIGLAVIDLGGGRTRPQDSIDPSVGFTGLVRPGDRLEKGDPIGMVHAADEASAARAESALRSAYRIGMVSPDACEPVVERLG
jgi:thymidine phosphorylase